jgi:hypothetical protein
LNSTGLHSFEWDGSIMESDELVRIWQKVVMVYISAMARHLLGETCGQLLEALFRKFNKIAYIWTEFLLYTSLDHHSNINVHFAFVKPVMTVFDITDLGQRYCVKNGIVGWAHLRLVSFTSRHKSLMKFLLTFFFLLLWQIRINLELWIL